MRISELLLKFVETECSIAYSSPIELYRGTNTAPSDAFIGTIRTDRKPKTSSKVDVRIFDLYCGIKNYPHRKYNTLSTTINVAQTRGYGSSTYRVYPDNSATYLYSTFDGDLLTLTTTFVGHLYKLYGNDDFEYKKIIEFYKFLNEMDDSELASKIKEVIPAVDEKMKIKYTSDLNSITDSAGEVLVHGHKFVANKVGNHAFV